ncbi:MAG TPA: superoxide dismutase [Cu-Zn] SodC [Hyphomicrobium sp.]|nr:superoxide dismutase [Cu-Zn] SodC [Hyphomicrobium sp.]
MKNLSLSLAALGAALTMAPTAAFCETASVAIHAITPEGVGAEIGKATISDSDKGAVIDIEVKGLTAGEHGMHIHEKGDCGPGEKDGKKVAGLAAGGHFDPGKTGKHAGPEGHGHMGDLPKLVVEGDAAKATLTAPHIKVGDVVGRSLMIHAGGDNYSDEPALGGGGARVACGVIAAAK